MIYYLIYKKERMITQNKMAEITVRNHVKFK